jgi:hypothetical protein
MALIDWIEMERQRKQEHFTAFSPVLSKQPDGLTLFQHQAVAALAPVIPSDAFERVSDKDQQGDVLVAPLGETGLEVHLYTNDSGIFGPDTTLWLEEWAFQTPQQLFETLSKEVKARAA